MLAGCFGGTPRLAIEVQSATCPPSMNLPRCPDALPDPKGKTIAEILAEDQLIYGQCMADAKAIYEAWKACAQ